MDKLSIHLTHIIQCGCNLTRHIISLGSSGMIDSRLGNYVLSICVMLCDRSVKA